MKRVKSYQTTTRSSWREEAFQIPDGSIVDGSVIWRVVERIKVKEDDNGLSETSDAEPGAKKRIEEALAEGLD